MVKPRPAQPTVKFIDDYCENYRGFAAKSLLVGLGVGRRSSVVGRFKLCCPLSLYQCMYCNTETYFQKLEHIKRKTLPAIANRVSAS